MCLGEEILEVREGAVHIVLEMVIVIVHSPLVVIVIVPSSFMVMVIVHSLLGGRINSI